MISPRKPENINPGFNTSASNNLSIWNSQFKTCLYYLNLNLNKALETNDRKSIQYFMGLISRLQYHPTLNWPTIVPFDMLLLQKTPSCLRRGCKDGGSKSRSNCKKEDKSKTNSIPKPKKTKHKSNGNE